MGYDYALVHLKYTIPPAILLSIIYAPLCTRLDLYRIGFLIAIAVASTIPWDSYLIRTNIWSYPSNVIVGPTLFDIPLEEVFFFIIQTFNTSLLYLILNKPILHSVYLVKETRGRKDGWVYKKLIGQLALAMLLKKGVEFVRNEGKFTYLGLILVWSLPFLLLLWSLAYQLLLKLPWTSTLLPIAAPTLYLWVVDTLALKRGTWVIEAATKTGWSLWPGLEIEEAVFFMVTNMLIVCGLVAFDNAIAILNTFPVHCPVVPQLPSPAMLVRALLLPASTYDDDRIIGLQQSLARLKAKSRSFYLASGTFSGRLRIDLVLLYSFCRLADDLIDKAETPAHAKKWVQKLQKFIDLSYQGGTKNGNGDIIPAKDVNQGAATLYAVQNFPREAHLTLLLLPTDRISKTPLDELLKGFEMDLTFGAGGDNLSGPIKTEADLDLYAARVAGTVALMCIELVLYHYPGTSDQQGRRLMAAGHDMGIALQYTNIARDLSVDAADGRCYVPQGWLKKEKLTPQAFTKHLVASTPLRTGGDDIGNDDEFMWKKASTVRGRLLDRSFMFYERSVGAIEDLPLESRAPMRVAVESYMQIAREQQRPGYRFRSGRATVPIWKRFWVAWWALRGPSKR